MQEIKIKGKVFSFNHEKSISATLERKSGEGLIQKLEFQIFPDFNLFSFTGILDFKF
jgi:hypothetical protein